MKITPSSSAFMLAAACLLLPAACAGPPESAAPEPQPAAAATAPVPVNPEREVYFGDPAPPHHAVDGRVLPVRHPDGPGDAYVSRAARK